MPHMNIDANRAARLRDIENNDALANHVGDQLAQTLGLQRAPGAAKRWKLWDGYLDKTSAGVARVALRIILGE